jgi:hypothetical protein
MRTGAFVAALTGAGLLGGIAGGMVASSGGGAAPPAAPGAPAAAPEGDEALRREVASLRARLEEMHGAVQASSQETARLRTEVEEQGRAVASTKERVSEMEAAPTRIQRAEPLPVALAGKEGALVRLEGATQALQNSLEMLGKSEEERWAKAREALGLSAYQEEELKAAIKEKNEAMAEAMRSMETARADGGGASRLRPDIEKMRDSRKRYDDRVAAALTVDQQKKWRDEGHERSLGGGGGFAIRTTVITTDAGEAK